MYGGRPRPELRGLPGGQRLHELEDRGHAAQVGDPKTKLRIAPGQELESARRVELAQDEHPPAHEERRVGEEVEPGDVTERQHGQAHRVGVHARRADDAEHGRRRRAVGEDHPLGRAGGAGSIDDRPGLGGADRRTGAQQAARLLATMPCRAERHLVRVDIVATPLAVPAEHGDAERTGHRAGLGLDEALVQQEAWPAVLAGGAQLGLGEAPVERDEDGAEPRAGVLQLDRVMRVARQQRDPVPALDTSADQVSSERLHPRIELGIREAPPVRQVIHRPPPRSPPRMRRNPRRHGSRGAHLRRTHATGSSRR
jgi:hypothetical protein